jgi:class 3 adenylate cyclase
MLAKRESPAARHRALELLTNLIRDAEPLGITMVHRQAIALRDSLQSASRVAEDVKHLAVDLEVFAKEDNHWIIGSRRSVFQLQHTKGLAYLAHLFHHPGVKFHPLEFVIAVDLEKSGRWSVGSGEKPVGSGRLASEELASEEPQRVVIAGAHDTSDVVDAQAKSSYRRRMEELRAALGNVSSLDPSDRSGKLEQEIEALATELERAVGSFGGDPHAASCIARAHLSVTSAIRAAIDQIAEKDASPARFLANSIQIGTFCAYLPADTEQTVAAVHTNSTRIDPLNDMAEAVVAKPPELREHSAPDGTVTLLFSDVENSSTLFERFGDLRAHEIMSAHNAIIREQLGLHKGFEVKAMGDGFMIAFSSARRALLCAISIQRAFAAYNGQHPDQPIRVKMGLHIGETISEHNDFFGQAVIFAARIAALAHGSEILVSSTMRDLTQTAGDFRFIEAGESRLKGFPGTHRLYRAIW